MTRLDDFSACRVAICHYWLVRMRGGEKVLEALCDLFPQADIYTHVVDRSAISPKLAKHNIYETRIGRLPFAKKLYQKYLPLMPRALEEVDLSGYDLVISSEAGPAKGVIPPPEARHLCYCHSPMRYLWDQYHVYREDAGRLSRWMMPHMAHRLRQWDVSSAARVDRFVANSGFVARRINKYWRREADVVHPPVAVEDFKPLDAAELGDFYLWAGELAPYERPDIAVEAFRRLDLPLVVIGGPDKAVAGLRNIAGPKTQFLHRAPFDVLRTHMARCKALIFPGEEDFGIVPVEVMASGRPIIAFKSGGALDSVVDGVTGLFFNSQTVDDLIETVERFERSDLKDTCRDACVAQAQKFSRASFDRGILEALARFDYVS